MAIFKNIRNKISIILIVLTAAVATLINSLIMRQMFSGIIDDCPSAPNSDFYPAYQAKTGSIPEPHSFLGIIIVLLILASIALTAGMFKYRGKKYRIFVLLFLLVSALIAVEIRRHTMLPVVCLFNG